MASRVVAAALVVAVASDDSDAAPPRSFVSSFNVWVSLSSALQKNNLLLTNVGLLTLIGVMLVARELYCVCCSCCCWLELLEEANTSSRVLGVRFLISLGSRRTKCRPAAAAILGTLLHPNMAVNIRNNNSMPRFLNCPFFIWFDYTKGEECTVTSSDPIG